MARYGEQAGFPQVQDKAPQSRFHDMHMATADETSIVMQWPSAFKSLDYKPVGKSITFVITCMGITADTTFSMELANDEGMTVNLQEYGELVIKAADPAVVTGQHFLVVNWSDVLGDYPDVATSKEWFVRLKTVTTGCTYSAQLGPWEENPACAEQGPVGSIR